MAGPAVDSLASPVRGISAVVGIDRRFLGMALWDADGPEGTAGVGQ